MGGFERLFPIRDETNNKLFNIYLNFAAKSTCTWAGTRQQNYVYGKVQKLIKQIELKNAIKKKAKELRK